MNCPHNSYFGDNYGTTCATCGQVLSGYGYWAEGSQTCQHQYLSDGDGSLVCAYCEDVKPDDDQHNYQD